MKKFLTNLILLLFINILISVYLSGIAICNVVPAIDLILLVVYAANSEKYEAATYGLVMGVIVDILFGTTFGFNALIYMYIALCVNIFSKKFMSNEPLSVLVLLLAAIFLYDMANFLFFLAFEGKSYGFLFIFKIVIPEMIYSTVLYFPLQYLVLKYKRLEKKLFN